MSKVVKTVRASGFRLFNVGGRSKNKRISKISIICLTVILLTLLWWFNTFTLKTTKIEILDSKINNEITFVHITDLHGSSFGSNNKSLSKRIKNQSPDFIVVTGDMYTSDSEKGEKTALNLLSALAEDFSVYYINGEHDNSETFFEKLNDTHVRILNYEEELITIENTTLHLYGINNVYYTSTFDLSNEFVIDEENFTILLSHGSNFNKFASFGVDLSLSGDTHGGQVRLPFVGAIQNSGIWFPELIDNSDENIKYTKGLYQKDSSKLFVSSGLGNFPIPFRLMNRPEIAVIKLLPTK